MRLPYKNWKCKSENEAEATGIQWYIVLHKNEAIVMHSVTVMPAIAKQRCGSGAYAHTFRILCYTRG